MALLVGYGARPERIDLRRPSVALAALAIAAALLRAGWFVVGLLPAGAYDVTIHAYACPPGIGFDIHGPPSARPAECTPAEATEATWRLEGGNLEQPLTSADAKMEGGTASWRSLPAGYYRITVTAAALSPDNAFVAVPSRYNRLVSSSNGTIAIELGDDASGYRGMAFRAPRSATFDALLIARVLDPAGRGELVVTPYRCPTAAGRPISDGTFNPAACSADPDALTGASLSAWPTNEQRFDLAAADRVGASYVWRDLPHGPYALRATTLALGGERYKIPGLSLSPAGDAGGTLPDDSRAYLLPSLDASRPRIKIALYVVFADDGPATPSGDP